MGHPIPTPIASPCLQRSSLRFTFAIGSRSHAGWLERFDSLGGRLAVSCEIPVGQSMSMAWLEGRRAGINVVLEAKIRSKASVRSDPTAQAYELAWTAVRGTDPRQVIDFAKRFLGATIRAVPQALPDGQHRLVLQGSGRIERKTVDRRLEYRIDGTPYNGILAWIRPHMLVVDTRGVLVREDSSTLIRLRLDEGTLVIRGTVYDVFGPDHPFVPHVGFAARIQGTGRQDLLQLAVERMAPPKHGER